MIYIFRLGNMLSVQGNILYFDCILNRSVISGYALKIHRLVYATPPMTCTIAYRIEVPKPNGTGLKQFGKSLSNSEAHRGEKICRIATDRRSLSGKASLQAQCLSVYK